MLKASGFNLRGVTSFGATAVSLRLCCEGEAETTSAQVVNNGNASPWPPYESITLGSEEAVAIAQAIAIEVVHHAGKPRERVLLRASVSLHDLFDRSAGSSGLPQLTGWFSLYPAQGGHGRARRSGKLADPPVTSQVPDGEVSVCIEALFPLPERSAARPTPGHMSNGEEAAADVVPNTLRVTVHACRALAGGEASSSSSSSSRSLNPCAKVSLGRHEGRTGVASGTGSPVWNEAFALPACEPLPQEGLKISIENIGVLRSDPLGCIDFHPDDLASLRGSKMRRWLPLLSPGGAFDRPRGEVDVTLSWDRLPSDRAPRHAKKLSESEAAELEVAAAGQAAMARSIAVTSAGTGAGTPTRPSASAPSNSTPGKHKSRPISHPDDDSASIGPGGTPWGDVDNEGVGGEEEAVALAKEEAAERKAAEEAAISPLREGDYQVTVHVIEGRNMKPMDSTGTSDPVVYIEVMGKKQHTRIIPKMNSAVWDQTFAWSLPQLTMDTLEEASIRVAVYDADSFSGNDLIGAYSFDMASVYSRNNHELWRTWVALADDSSHGSAGLTGLLKLSVTVLGPGDRPVLHGPEDDGAGEDPEAGDGGMGDIRGAVLMPPSLDRTLKFLVITVYCAEGLPSMDFLNGIDAFVKVSFGGGAPAKTRWVTKKGKGDLGVDFHMELWLPVLCPPLADVVSLSVWDFDRLNANDLVATTHMRFRDVEQRALPPTYLCLYGAPPGWDAGKDAGTMNRYPALATHYRGRLLLSARVEGASNTDQDKVHTKSISTLPLAFMPREDRFILQALIVQGEELPSFSASAGNLFGLAPSDLGVMICIGNTAVYTGTVKPDKGLARWGTLLRAEVVLPARKGSAGLLGRPSHLPHHKIGKNSKKGKNSVKGRRKGGSGQDEEDEVRAGLLRTEGEEEEGEGEKSNGSDPVQDYERWQGYSCPMPDTFVYLYRGDPGPLTRYAGTGRGKMGLGSASTDGPFKSTNCQPVCFARLPTLDLLDNGFTASLLKWVDLKEVTAVNALGDEEKPGALLMRVGIGSDADAKLYATQWDAEVCDWAGTGGTPDLPSPGATSAPPPPPPPACPVELRVHAYRGADLPSADDDGSLDPYLKVRFNGQSVKSKWVPKTRFPGWFETVCLPTSLVSPNPRYAPRVHVELWDHDDITADDFVSEMRFDLASPACHLTSARSLPALPPVPTWYDLQRYETGVSNVSSKARVGQGRLLLTFQLIRKERSVQSIPVPVLQPLYRDMWVELMVVGLRSLDPTAGLATSAPFLEIDGGERGVVATAGSSGGGSGGRQEVGSALATSGHRVRRTGRSRKPTGRDPNFVERVLLPIRVPLDPLFAPVLNIVAKDWRLGGLSTPAIGTTSIPLASAIPWNPSYRPPGRGALLPSLAHPDVCAGDGDGGEQEDRDTVLSMDDSPPPSPQAQTGHGKGKGGGKVPYRELTEVEDEAIDVDSSGNDKNITSSPTVALEANPLPPHPALSEGSRYPPMLDASGTDSARFLLHLDGAEGAEDTDDTARVYMSNRRVYNAGLEDVFLSSPFEGWSLMRGQRVGRGRSLLSLGTAARADDTRVCGKLKGMMRLLASPDEPPLVPVAALKPLPVVIRVYVLTGHDLMALDDNGASDPYIVLRLGGQTVSGRAAFLPQTLNPAFYQMYEVKTILPGPSQLSVEVWDRDLLSPLSDDLIGSTQIDLEDRYFAPWWRSLGIEAQTFGRFRPLPVESRPLWCPTSTAPQGSVRLWVDILTPAQASRYAPVKIAPPPPAEYDVRLVVWGTRRVKEAMDGKSSDLFVRSSFPGCPSVDTDTHWRVKTGRASFNYRSHFKAMLPLKKAQDGYLTLQLYDKDVVMSSELLGEATLNLSPYFKASAKAGAPTHVFDTDPHVVGKVIWRAICRKKRRLEKEAAALAAAEEKARRKASGIEDDGDDEDYVGGAGDAGTGMEWAKVTAVLDVKVDEAGWEEQEKGRGRDGAKGRVALLSLPWRKKGEKGGSNPVKVEGGDDEDDDDVLEAVRASGKGKGKKRRAVAAAQPAAPVVSPLNLASSKFGPVQKLSAGLAGGAQPAFPTDGEAAPGAAGEAPSPSDAARDTVDKLRELAGSTDMVARPRHAQYTPMYKVTYASGIMVLEKVGEVLISIEIMPAACAEAYPAGKGRGDPNTYPYLPPPLGRTNFTLNPFSLLGELVGVRAFFAFVTSTLAGVGSTVLFLGVPYLQSLLALPYQLMIGLGVLSLVLLLMSFLGCGARFCCQKKAKEVREVDVNEYAAAIACNELEGEEYGEDGEEGYEDATALEAEADAPEPSTPGLTSKPSPVKAGKGKGKGSASGGENANKVDMGLDFVQAIM